jgi:hypothetical protein
MSFYKNALEVMKQHQDQFPDRFVEWLPFNPEVWQRFCAEAIAVHQRGFKHYSARTIIHILRHHSSVRETTGPWKLCDHHSPYLARLFDLTHPERAGLWTFKETKLTIKNKFEEDSVDQVIEDFWPDSLTQEANRRVNKSWSLMCKKMVAAEQDRCCRIIFGLCVSDNNAQEIVNKIRSGE